jgi:hypothetical protein
MSMRVAIIVILIQTLLVFVPVWLHLSGWSSDDIIAALSSVLPSSLAPLPSSAAPKMQELIACTSDNSSPLPSSPLSSLPQQQPSQSQPKISHRIQRILMVGVGMIVAASMIYTLLHSMNLSWINPSLSSTTLAASRSDLSIIPITALKA